jgi:hypothetical protein
VYEIGAVPDHVPVDVVNCCPCCATPDTTGNPEFDGADADATTTAVASDTAVDEPAVFVPVTAARNVEPTSPCTNVYELDVAFATSTQFAPPESHLRH